MSIDLIKNPASPNIVSDSTTADALYAYEISQGAIKKGYDINKLMVSSGISPWLIENPKGRVTLRQIADLSTGLSDLMNDEFYGLIEKPSRRGTFKFMCHSALNADNAHDAMQMFCQYMNLYENTWSHELVQEKDHLIYRPVTRRGFQLAHPIALEFLLSSLYRTLCWMTNSQLPLLKVNLAISKPVFPARYRFMFYNTPMVFEQQQSSLVFPTEALKTTLVRDKQELKDFLKHTPLTLLTQTVPIEDVSSQVRTYLERRLLREKKLPTIEETCEHLKLHPQALRRKLIKENSSFSQIKVETRRDLAISMVHEEDHRVAEIAERLDFSETSAFVRAFKQWTGLTPKNYQLRLQGN